MSFDQGPELENVSLDKKQTKESSSITYIKSYQHLGTSLTNNGSIFLVACAPNIITRVQNNEFFHGMCFEDDRKLNEIRYTYFQQIFG